MSLALQPFSNFFRHHISFTQNTFGEGQAFAPGVTRRSSCFRPPLEYALSRRGAVMRFVRNGCTILDQDKQAVSARTRVAFAK